MNDTLAKAIADLRDQTESRKAELFDLLANYIPATIWIADEEGALLFISKKWTDYTGLTCDETTQRWKEVIHPDDADQFLRCWRPGSDRDDTEVAVRVRCAETQKYLWHIVRSVPVMDQTSKPYWVGAITDINGQKHAEQILQTVIDSMPGSIWWKDKEGRYLGCSTRTAVNAGFASPAEVMGRTDFELAWKDQAEFYRACDRDVMEKNEPINGLIEPVTTATGKTTWIETNKVPLLDPDGTIVGTVGNYVDISERLKLINQREDFMASLAHDLKVPIVGSIRAFDVLLNGALGPMSEEQSEFILKIQTSQQQLLTIIQNVLQVLRYEASPDELVASACDLTSLMRSCISDVEPICTAKGVKLRTRLPDKLEAVVDAVAIKRLLHNLLGNASKFTPGGGTITVTATPSETEVEIAVADTGLGIDKDDQSKLFQRFWQGGAVKRYAAETGLGLYLCRQIAEGHGGSIGVVSKVGEGANFIVRIPIAGPARKVDMRFIPNTHSPEHVETHRKNGSKL